MTHLQKLRQVTCTTRWKFSDNYRWGVYLLHGVDVPHADRVVLSDSGEVASDRVDWHGKYMRRVWPHHCRVTPTRHIQDADVALGVIDTLGCSCWMHWWWNASRPETDSLKLSFVSNCYKLLLTKLSVIIYFGTLMILY